MSLRNLMAACLVLASSGGCETGRSGSLSPAPTDPQAAAPGAITMTGVNDAGAMKEIPDALNNARGAAQYTALLPGVTDRATQREIELHALLYRAAWKTNVGDFTRHFLLEPAQGGISSPLSINESEFRLRVLGRLVDLGVPICWTDSLSGNPVELEIYPHTRELATRLRIAITERNDDSTTIRGEIEDWTVSVGASRQGITVSWDGDGWTLTRDRVRLVW